MHTHAKEAPCTDAPCADVPQFDRLSYFYGQMLHARDLQIEQAYFREKMKLHNRCLHGWGVVCGLEVTPPPPDPDCIPETDARRKKLQEQLDALGKQLAAATTDAERVRLREAMEKVRRELDATGRPSDCAPEDPRTKVRIDCGLALDCLGNEIVVRHPMLVDLWSALSPEDRAEIDSGKTKTLWVALCYRECPVDPVRPVVADVCGATADCAYGKLRDSVSVVVTTDGTRWHDERCEPCCEECEEGCVLLARIDGFEKGHSLTPAQVHGEVRRPVSLRVPTTITAINWVQGGTYTPDQASELLGSTKDGTGGIEIVFSRKIRTESIVEGTVDTWVIEGGKGQSAEIYNKVGVLVLPTTPTTDRIIYRDDTNESLQDGDRVLITVRSAHLLDYCCRPVEGAFVGGRVPRLPNSPPATKTPLPTACLVPPGGIGPWTSGGAGATTLEGWIWIKKD